VQSAVLRECVVNLARVKESIAQNVSGTLDAIGLDAWPELMRGIKAGLLMLGKARAVDVVDALTLQLRRVMQPGGMPLSGAYLDRLADAVVSLEYYIETLQAGRSDPWYMLDNAQRCIEFLVSERGSPVPTVSAVLPVSATQLPGARTEVLASGAAVAPHLHAPTLVLMGADDPIVPPINGRIVAARLRRATLETVDCGHLFVMTRPAETARRVERFMAEHPLAMPA